MEDFDMLYMMKTPFYMGSFTKVPQEGLQVELSQEDQKNVTLKNLFIVRALTSVNDFG